MVSGVVVKGGKVLPLGLAKEQLAESIFFVGDPAWARRVADCFDDIDSDVSNREYASITRVRLRLTGHFRMGS